MPNFLLFQQSACLLLFLETLVLWPKFYRYFGPPCFPGSKLNTKTRIAAFNLFLLSNLALLFFNVFPLLTSFAVAACMRYLYVSDATHRIFTAGAVGHLCYFTAAYLFLFHAAAALDPANQLLSFFHSVFAIEMGIMMMAAGVYKYLFGYLNDTGVEYALANPNWGKLFFLFNKVPPQSLFFKCCNYGACLSEVLCGLLLLIPQTREWGAILLVLIFFYVFLTLKLSILPLLMGAIALLYLPQIPFAFPSSDILLLRMDAPPLILAIIKAVVVLYLAIYIFTTVYRMLRTFEKVTLHQHLENALGYFVAARPFFEWGVFSPSLTNFFIRIDKAAKPTREPTAVVYDGFSKHYREILFDTANFFRFSHHHESSCLLNIFMPIYVAEGEDKLQHVKWFETKMSRYAKTLLADSEARNLLIRYTIVYIEKTSTGFIYTPLHSYFLDVELERVIDMKVYK